MKIVVLDGYTENPGDLSWDALGRLGELEVYDYTAAEEILPRMRDADVVYTNKTPILQDTILRCPRLKMIGVLATGYNVVDARTAGERGIPVCNVPAYGASAVAQHTFALLLELCHHAGDHDRAVRRGRWSACRDFCFWDSPLIELSGKVMGIVGYGRIGEAVARIARAFGMTALAHDPFPKAGEDLPEMAPLARLFARADVITLHCPLLPQTERLIREETIRQMKDGVIILNTARGPLIDEAALRAALQSGKVYAAAVDVLREEPPRADNPLLGLENCLITPHIAWAPKESRQRLMDTAVENLRAFLAGEPVNVVNADALRARS